MDAQTATLVERLSSYDGKAEIVNGRIMCMAPTGDMPAEAGGAAYVSLRAYARSTGFGRAYPDNAAFVVDLPFRKSFSPDASLYVGPRSGMRFLNGAPAFAVEVRSEHDYGPSAERELEAKRADYFAAGTGVVWDVDLLADDVVRKFTSDAPTAPVCFRRGEIANAEPAVPGWTMPVDEFFE